MWISTDPALGENISGAGKANTKDAGNLPDMGGAFNHINFNLYHYGGNNPVRYVDPDGAYVITKNKETGNYALSSFRNGISNFHYATKMLSNFVPLGSSVLRLEKPLSNIDPTTKNIILYNSDCPPLISISNELDVISLSSVAKQSEHFSLISKFVSIWGLKDVVLDFKNDGIINDFMNNQATELFKGCLSDHDAINLGKYLAEGALYYQKNESQMNEKDILKSEWGRKIRNSTNGFLGDSKFESFEQLFDK